MMVRPKSRFPGMPVVGLSALVVGLASKDAQATLRRPAGAMELRRHQPLGHKTGPLYRDLLLRLRRRL